MKFLYKITLWALISFLCITCKEEDVTSRNYPRLNTLEVTDISKKGAKFNAEFMYRGDFDILTHGFVWSEQRGPLLDNADRIVYSEPIKSETFSAEITTTLSEGAVYSVRPFVRTQDYLVYGETVTFLSLGSQAPLIEKIHPLTGTIGDTLTLFGKGFSHVNNKNEVLFDDVQATTLESSDSTIKVVIPKVNQSSYQISLNLSGTSSAFEEAFTVSTPIIEEILPEAAFFGEVVTIKGKNFSHSTNENKVLLGNIAIKPFFSSKNEIKFNLPNNLESSQSSLTLTVAGRTDTYENIFVKGPIITSISPAYINSYYSGAIELIGENFNPIPDKNEVRINQIQARVLTASHSKITFEFPAALRADVQEGIKSTLDITLSILGQEFTLEDQLIIDYSNDWENMDDFPGNPRIYGTSFSINGKGYIGLGGWKEYDKWYKDFWEYNPANDFWTRLSDFPGEGRSKFVTFVINSKAYIITGTKGNAYLSDNSLSEVWEFDSQTGNWTKKNDFPGGARWSAFGFSINNRGYVGGGIYGNAQKQNDFWKYESVNDSWTKLNDLPTELWNEDIFAISNSENGFVLAQSENQDRDFWKYNPINDSWSRGPSLPDLLKITTGFVFNNDVYIGTGEQNKPKNSSSFYKYNPGLDSWTFVGFNGAERNAASSFTIGNYGYILLGRANCDCANRTDVWKFDPTSTD
ncbi:IPT/TIG domain-containing protein [Catalinimonas niigatensis]|uniref:IPT/TIG domain-containing protein n=1 Tax=Catalinimonas niigatensis TaxID=1397264 RepID=UPI002666FD50|nr:IPT/TIG domain-containing protein [Catalinimonas niigatensis]WPP48421.1 IPT/TIG domain-containing protein [Catalinimonas niigatensis]